MGPPYLYIAVLVQRVPGSNRTVRSVAAMKWEDFNIVTEFLTTPLPYSGECFNVLITMKAGTRDSMS